MQDDSSDRVAPTQHVGRVGAVDDEIGFSANLNDTNVRPAQREGASTSDQVEGLLDRHWAVGRDLPLVKSIRVAFGPQGLKPKASLVDHGRAVGKVAVYTKGGLILNVVGVRVDVTKVELALGGGRDVLVCVTEELCILVGHEATVREDDRNGFIEPSVRVEGRGAVGEAPRTTQVMSCHDGKIGPLRDVPKSADVGVGSIEETIVGKTKRKEAIVRVEAMILRHALQLADLLVPAPSTRNLVDGMGIYSTDSAVNRSIDTAVCALFSPACMSVVKNSGCANVYTFQTSGKLSEVEVLRSEDGRGLAVLAEFLEVIG